MKKQYVVLHGAVRRTWSLRSGVYLLLLLLLKSILTTTTTKKNMAASHTWYKECTNRDHFPWTLRNYRYQCSHLLFSLVLFLFFQWSFVNVRTYIGTYLIAEVSFIKEIIPQIGKLFLLYLSKLIFNHLLKVIKIINNDDSFRFW